MSDLTTVAVYKSDVKELEQMMTKGETFREKIHELILNEKVKGGKDNVHKEKKRS